MSDARASIVALGPAGWRELLRTGGPVAPAELPGDWRGISLGLPPFIEVAGWRVSTPSFFVLERLPSVERPPPLDG